MKLATLLATILLTAAAWGQLYFVNTGHSQARTIDAFWQLNPHQLPLPLDHLRTVNHDSFKCARLVQFQDADARFIEMWHRPDVMLLWNGDVDVEHETPTAQWIACAQQYLDGWLARWPGVVLLVPNVTIDSRATTGAPSYFSQQMPALNAEYNAALAALSPQYACNGVYAGCVIPLDVKTMTTLQSGPDMGWGNPTMLYIDTLTPGSQVVSMIVRNKLAMVIARR